MARLDHDIDNRLTGLAVAYMNQPSDFIAEQIAPRVPSKTAGQYQRNATGVNFQNASGKIAYGARADEIYTKSNLVAYHLQDYGLDAPVDLKENESVSADRMTMDIVRTSAMEAVLNAMRIIHEVEVRDMVYTTGHYASNLHGDIASAQQFNKSTANPIKAIREALEKPLARPNAIVCGRKVFDALASNGNVNRAVHRNDGDVGWASAGAMASLFGVQRIIVGDAWGAVDGIDDTPSARIWDSADNLALVRIERPTSMRTTSATLCVTASCMGGLQVRRFIDHARGPKGSEVIRPIDERLVLHISDKAGYLMTNCLD